MFPLDFEEFLWAMGISETAISGLKEFFDDPSKIPDELTSQNIRPYLTSQRSVHALILFLRSWQRKIPNFSIP